MIHEKHDYIILHTYTYIHKHTYIYMYVCMYIFIYVYTHYVVLNYNTLHYIALHCITYPQKQIKQRAMTKKNDRRSTRLILWILLRLSTPGTQLPASEGRAHMVHALHIREVWVAA